MLKNSVLKKGFSSFFRPPPQLPEHDVLSFADGSLRYSIRESHRRRSLALTLRADGSLNVAAPYGVTLGLIRLFVEDHRAWIENRRAKLAALAPARAGRTLEQGSALPYLGRELTLAITIAPARRRNRCRLEADQLDVQIAPAASIRNTIEAWYRAEAARHGAERLAHFAPRVGRSARRLSIRAQRTRWGSCSSRGAISLNWRLMQATPEIFDYVVVHELCHLLVPNHSPRFWNEVRRVLPDYAPRRAALRQFGRALSF